MPLEELRYWEVRIDQEVVLDATPDPDEAEDGDEWALELDQIYSASRGC